MRRSAAILTASVLAALACGGLPFTEPEIHGLVVTQDDCGRWTADILAGGWDAVVELRVDGAPHGSWTVRGQQTITVQGVSPPGRTVTFEAVTGDSSRTEQVAMPALATWIAIAPPRATFAPGSSPSFEVTVATQCAVDGFRYSARVDEGVWEVVNQPLARTGGTIRVPPLERGHHELVVELGVGDVPAGRQTAAFYVGQVGEDLDRDGSAGGLDGPDCDDGNARVSPKAAEAAVANGVDDDCDGVVDEGTTAYDDDGDGVSEDAGDCDDGDRERHPGAPEVADCRDQDCDELIDEDAPVPMVDDAYEANDGAHAAFALNTSRRRRFSERLELVHGGEVDEEWFVFYSDDGDWDGWGIRVVAEQLPQGGVYDVAVWRDGARVKTGRLSSDGDVVRVSGAGFRDDSGTYQVSIAGLRVGPWCPARVRIDSD